MTDDAPQPEHASTDFEREAETSQPGLIAEFWDFLVHNKKWWLAPIIIVLLLAAALAIWGSSAFAPFIYTF